MWVERKNVFDGKAYCWDVDDIDSEEFDVKLHDNTATPIIFHSQQCMYCKAIFPSRNRLFQHLGFMNIDIRRPQHMQDQLMLGNDADSHSSRTSKRRKNRKRWRNFHYMSPWRRVYRRQLNSSSAKIQKKKILSLGSLIEQFTISGK